MTNGNGRLRQRRMEVAAVVALLATGAAAQTADPPRDRVSGIVRDARGQPWAGARVVLFARAVPPVAWLDDTDLVEVLTNERGRFRAQLLPARRYSAWAHSPPGGGRYRVTRVLEDVIAGMAVRLEERGTNLASKIRIAGTEPWRAHAPLSARVWSHHPVSVLLVPLQLSEAHESVLPPLPGDGCFVEVFGKNRFPIASVFVPLTEPRWRRHEVWLAKKGRRSVRLGRAGGGAVVLELAKPGKVTVRVKTAGGKPAAGASVYREMGAMRGAFSPVGTTNADGIVGVAMPGTDSIESNFLARLAGHAASLAIPTLVVAPGAGGKPVDLVAHETHELRGRILYRDEEPAADLKLLVYSPVSKGTSYNMWVGPLLYRTDGEGRFAIDAPIAKLGYRIEAVPTPEQAERTPLKGLSGTAIVVAAGKAAADKDYGNIRIDRLARVDVRIAGGERIDRVHILAYPVGAPGTQTHYLLRLATDRRGRTSMLVPKGSHWWFLGGKNGVSFTGEARTADVAELVARLEPRPEHVISGRVLDASGRPAAGVRVHALNLRAGGKTTGRLAAAGYMRNASRAVTHFDGDLFFSDEVDYYRRCRFWSWFAHRGDHARTDRDGRFRLLLPKSVRTAQIAASLPSPPLVQHNPSAVRIPRSDVELTLKGR